MSIGGVLVQLLFGLSCWWVFTCWWASLCKGTYVPSYCCDGAQKIDSRWPWKKMQWDRINNKYWQQIFFIIDIFVQKCQYSFFKKFIFPLTSFLCSPSAFLWNAFLYSLVYASPLFHMSALSLLCLFLHSHFYLKLQMYTYTHSFPPTPNLDAHKWEKSFGIHLLNLTHSILQYASSINFTENAIISCFFSFEYNSIICLCQVLT